MYAWSPLPSAIPDVCKCPEPGLRTSLSVQASERLSAQGCATDRLETGPRQEPIVFPQLPTESAQGLAGFAAAKEHLSVASTELTELVNCGKKGFLPHRRQGCPNGDHDVGRERE